MRFVNLNIPNMRAFIAALRSKKFKKISGSLHAYWRGKNAYCALGVAAHLAGCSNQELQDQSYLPKKAQEWLGVKSSNPFDIAGHNDRGDSFAEIADMLEKKLPKHPIPAASLVAPKEKEEGGVSP